MPNKQPFFISIVALVITLFSGIYSQNMPDVTPMPDGVSIRTLDNGLEVLLIENHALPMIGINAVVKIGSAYETFATSGMSHMLEHLLFNGTTSRTQKQLYDDVDLIGGYNNANTSEYFTNYMMVAPAEHIEKAMEIQADMLFNSVLPEEKFIKEKGIVLEEISKSLADPKEQFERNILSVLYKGHALSLPTLGTYSTIEHMNRDDVYAFYKNNYVPNNMIVSVIGNFNSEEMLALLNDIYGRISPGQISRPDFPQWKTGFTPLPESLNYFGLVFHRYYDGKDDKVQLFYLTENNDAFLNLLDLVLHEKKDELEELLKKDFPDNIKNVEIETRRTPIRSFIQLTISLKKNSDFEAVAEKCGRFMRETDFHISPERVRTEITKSRTDFLKNIEKPHMFGIYNAQKFAVAGIESVLASYSGKNLQQAALLLNNYKITGQPLIICQYAAKQQEENKKGSEIITELLQDEKIGKNLIAVQNGSSNLLAVHYLIKHKAMYNSKYGKDGAKILHDCLEQRFKSEEARAQGSAFGLKFVFNDIPFIPMDDIYLHHDFGYIRVEGLADSISGAIKYLNGYIKNFVPSKAEYNKAVRKFSMGNPMMRDGNKSKKLFEKTYKSYIYEESAYPEPTETISYENLVKMAGEYLRPENMIISVVSPAPATDIDKALIDFFDKPFPNEPSAEDQNLKNIEKSVTFVQNGDGKRSYLFWGFIKNIDPKDVPALKALSLILGDKIVFDVREKRGMAYRISAGAQITDDKVLFYINQGTRAQNVETLTKIYPEFFKSGIVKKLTATELQKTINMYLGRMMFRRLSSINRAYYLAHSLYFHNDINYDKNFLDNLKKVTVKDVQQAANKYLKIENPVSVIIK